MARILVIDDDIQILEMLRQTLEHEGYEVVDALDGKEGLRLYREAPTDLVITDIIMPAKEGVEMIIELRRDFPDVKIIAMSGGGRVGPKNYLGIAKKLGVMRTFTKPVPRQDMIKAVKELLE
ncbi:MAG: response regulator [Deltaproteobacteria bacterium]|uniref:Response regulator n=1 Tax=Candidatus Methanogaster sp. TaxID=3386292 RepID=A0AC61L131_9EURY|nr:MAG: response regulator [ANME-2 cluster archaeon]PXF60292.1 MAG: response regulator [Deltaproteobacteria bacterium]